MVQCLADDVKVLQFYIIEESSLKTGGRSTSSAADPAPGSKRKCPEHQRAMNGTRSRDRSDFAPRCTYLKKFAP